MAFFSTLTGKALITFFISMVPVIELRGAIPYAMAQGIAPWAACFISIILSLIHI